jgi:hypothetical protein
MPRPNPTEIIRSDDTNLSYEITKPSDMPNGYLFLSKSFIRDNNLVRDILYKDDFSPMIVILDINGKLYYVYNNNDNYLLLVPVV